MLVIYQLKRIKASKIWIKINNHLQPHTNQKIFILSKYIRKYNRIDNL